MLMKGSGIGRDVIFTTKVVNDPANKAVFKGLGDEMAKLHKQMTSNAAAETKRQADERAKTMRSSGAAEIREALKRDKQIADAHLKEHLRAIDAKKKEEERFARWRENLVRNSAVLEHREALRLLRERKAEEARLAREQVRQHAAATALSTRRFESTNRIVGGIGNIGRGLAYSGIIGEENTQKVINTLAGVESVGSLYRGGTDLYRGVRGLRGAGVLATAAGAAGSAAGGAGATAGPLAAIGAAAAPVVAGLAALASTAAAATSALGTIRDVAKFGFGGGSQPGSWNDRVGTGFASLGTWAAGKLPTGVQDFLADRTGFTPLGAAAANARAQRQLAAQQRGLGFDAEIRQRREAFRQQTVGQFESLATGGPGETIQQAVGRFGTLADLHKRAASSGDKTLSGSTGDALLKAEQSVLSVVREQRAESVRMAQDRLNSARTELELRRQTSSELRQQAQEAARAYKGDLFKLGTASAEEKSILRQIALKRDSGQTLSQEEIGVASQYEGLRGIAESSAERYARESGLSDLLFGDLRRKSEDLAARSADAIKAEATAKVQVENVQRVLLEITGKAESDGEILAQFKPLLDAIKQERSDRNAAIKAAVEQAIGSFANSRRVT